MNGITDLFKSERGIISLALLVAATVLAAVGKMTVDQWEHFSEIILGIYVTGKTITGAMTLWNRADTATSDAVSTVASAAVAYVGHLTATSAAAAAAGGVPGVATVQPSDLEAAAILARFQETMRAHPNAMAEAPDVASTLAQAQAAQLEATKLHAQLEAYKASHITKTP